MKKADKDYADSGHCVFAAKSSTKLGGPGYLVQMERQDIKPLNVYYNTDSDDGSSDDDKGGQTSKRFTCTTLSRDTVHRVRHLPKGRRLEANFGRSCG